MVRPGRAAVRPLSVGVGARRGTSAAEVWEALTQVLREGGVSPDAVARLATVDARAAEPALLAAARRLGVPLHSYSPGALGEVVVPNPSETALGSVGTPSVAEAAALLAAGEGARLLVAKRKPVSAAATSRPGRVTVAVARGRATLRAADGDAGAETSGASGALNSLPHPYGPGRRSTRSDE